MDMNFSTNEKTNSLTEKGLTSQSVSGSQYSNNMSLPGDQNHSNSIQPNNSNIQSNQIMSGVQNMSNSIYNNSSMAMPMNTSIQMNHTSSNGINNSSIGMNVEGMDMNNHSAPNQHSNMNIQATGSGPQQGHMNMPNQAAGGFQNDNMHPISDQNNYKNQMQPMNNYMAMQQSNGMMMNTGNMMSGNPSQMQGHTMPSQPYVNMHGNSQGMMPPQQQQMMPMAGLPNGQSGPNDVNGMPRQIMMQNPGVNMQGTAMTGMSNSNPPRMNPMQQNQSMNQTMPQNMQSMPHQHMQNMPMMYNNHGMSNMSHPPLTAQALSQQQAQLNSQVGIGNTKMVKRNWHSLDHGSTRSSMVEKIISLLKQRRPNASDDWHEKLPHMAKRLEEALYGQAEDLNQYSDTTTLKVRLQQLALSMGGNKQAGRHMDPSGRMPPPHGSMQPIQYQQQVGMPPNQSGMPQQQMSSQPLQNQMQHSGTQATNQYMMPSQPMQQGYMMNGQSTTGQYPVHMYPQSGTMHNNMAYQTGTNMDGHSMNHMNQIDGSINGENHNLPQQRHPQYMPMNQMNPSMSSGGNPQLQMPHNQGMINQGHGMQPGMNTIPMQTKDPNVVGTDPSKPIASRPYQQQQPLGSYPHNINMQQSSMPGMQQGQTNNQIGNSIPQLPSQQMNISNNHMAPQPGMVGQQTYNMPHMNGNMMPQGSMTMNQNQQMVLPHGIPGGMNHVNHSTMPQAMGTMQPQSSLSGPTPGGLPTSQNPAHTEEHRRQVLKQQQQRLLLLRHASKCPHEAGRCTVTPHCANMKSLWKHIMSCKDQECKVPHCVSSRYVLSHYSKCKDQQCPVCGPVREAIRRNYERSKEQIEISNKTLPPPAQQGRQRNAGNVSAVYDDEQSGQNQRKGYKGNQQGGMAGSAAHDMSQNNLVITAQAKAKNIYPLDPISCAVYSFTPEQIAAHFKSIHEGMRLSASKIKESFLGLIDEILRWPNANSVFGYPVDPVALSLPDYFDIIKMPMDLGTIRKRLDSCSYRDVSNLVFDVHLTFNNATTYNQKGSDVHSLAKQLKKEFDTKHRAVMADIEKSIDIARDNSDTCLICGEIKLLYEPPVYYCNGKCGGQRIRRAATFYSTKTNNYHWCNQCYNELKDSVPIRLPDCTILKSDLVKKKHNEDSEEPWVQCDGPCERWVHQICGLFNGRRNTGDECHFVCPNCIVDKRRKAGPSDVIIAPTDKKMKADDLPHCNLSQYLEKRIHERLEIAYRETAAKRNIRVEDVEKCPALFLRQVSCYDKSHHVREGVFERYKHKNYPAELPCRTKCVILFQNIDGQDVILFGMYVYEYGHKCPQPNQRRVYISYLDSVHYFRPKQYRTLVYHEILISYLDYVKARGFHTAHIWACPPQKGDDYILYVHPPDQKTPRPDKLRNWYQDMLLAAKARGIVHEITDLHTEFMADTSNDATVLPYFEGDYWVNEAEVIIKDLSNPGAADENALDDEAGKSKRKSKSKRAGRLAKVSITPKTERDPLMAKLSNMIEPMKDTFFVVRLHPKEYADACAEARQAELVAESSDTKLSEIEAQNKAQLQEEALSNNNVASDIPNVAQEEQRVATDNNSRSTEEAGENKLDQSNPEGDEDGFNALAAGISCDNPSSNDEKPEEKDDNNKLHRSSSMDSMDLGGQLNDNQTVSEIKSDPDNMDETAVENTGNGSGSIKSKKRKASEALVQSTSKIPREANAQDKSDTNAESSISTILESDTYTMAESKTDEDMGRAASNPMAEESVVKEEEKSATEENAVTTTSNQSDMTRNESSDTLKEETKLVEVASSGPREHQAYPGLFCAVPIERDDTEDVDDVQESEHFDSRQSVLNLCQGNHYQFDQLRRAKHTSMMVLYHIHNPDAPKFVPTCNTCHRDILSGTRYRCENCDLDFCQSCLTQYGKGIHQHPLRAITISSNNQPQKLTKEQLRERQRSIQLHMQLLQHAANCVENAECKSRNCAKMKEFLKHDQVCTTKANKGCRLCIRVHNLLQLHARSCRLESCRVPHCHEIRDHLRQMELLQQQMDDRRRTMINEKYRNASSAAAATNDDD